jgi:quercetin dioxygenase-like cupin family protein
VNGPRVLSAGPAAAVEVAAGVVEGAIVPAIDGSELSASLLRAQPGSRVTVGARGRDLILYTLDGSGLLTLGAGPAQELGPGTAALVRDGQDAGLVVGDGGLTAVQLGAGAGCDRHAPLGELSPIARLDLDRTDRATSNRSFQVLFDMHNGSERVTVFVGVVPPGRAPWHFHQYDEIVWVLDGHGLYHLAGSVEEFQAGSAFRVRPREVHVVENAGGGDLLLLGMFTPAGSPAAAYLAQPPDDL